MGPREIIFGLLLLGGAYLFSEIFARVMIAYARSRRKKQEENSPAPEPERVEEPEEIENGRRVEWITEDDERWTGPAAWSRLTLSGEWEYLPAPQTGYKRTTLGEWTLPGEEVPVPRCGSCGATENLSLLWVSGKEEDARFLCPCGRSWLEPAWATPEMITRVRKMDVVQVEHKGEEIKEALSPDVQEIFRGMMKD